MKKQSKNLGITKACPNPNCRKVVIKSANFTGSGTFTTRCPHCGSVVLVEVKHTIAINIVRVVTITLLIVSIGYAAAVFLTHKGQDYAEIR